MQMSKPIKVSVILISYNHAKYLREAIESILNQTFSDFELIIWDDASTDESWYIIQSYPDSRILAFRNNVNKGSGNINKAISEIASGEYIAIHHSDDIWEPQKLEKQIFFLEENLDFGAVFTNALIIGENSELLEDSSNVYYSIFAQPNRSRYEWLNRFFYYGNALCHPSVLIRKICYEDCGLYRDGLNLIDDLDMWMRLCLKYEIYVLPEKLVRFRVRSNDMNTSTRPDAQIRRPFEFLQLLNNYKNNLTMEELIKVFPIAEKYKKPEGSDVGFALGMVALELKPNVFTELFGLNILFEALNDSGRAKIIDEIYGFRHNDFIELTAKHDIFSIELISSLKAQVQMLSSQLSTKEQAMHALSNQLQEITAHAEGLKSSLNIREKHSLWLQLREIILNNAYKPVKFFRRLQRWLFPPHVIK